MFTACVLTETQAAIRGSRAPHLQLGGLQGTAAYLVALVALAFAAPSAVTLSASAATITQPGSSSQHGSASRPGPSNDSGSASWPGPANDPGSPMAGYLDAADAPHAELDAYGAVASRLVVVRAGDCLWSLAERYLGAGDRYPEIASLNYGHEMGDGQVFTSASFIEPGWRLLLPGTAATARARPDSARPVSTSATRPPTPTTPARTRPRALAAAAAGSKIIRARSRRT